MNLVRRGPIRDVRNMDQARREKWARVTMVVPEQVDTPLGQRYQVVTRGPSTLPMGIRREGSDAGSRDAWIFFTHKYQYFDREATFYNVAGEGCLGARLSVRGETGLLLYDEVGANLKGSERVTESFHSALGVLRARALSPEGRETLPYAVDMLRLDLDLLEAYRLSTLLLQTQSPQRVLVDLHGLLQNPSVRAFAYDAFDDDDRETLADAAEGDADLVEVRALRFRVEEGDFTQIADVMDKRGRQVIIDLLHEWETFEQEQGPKVRELSAGIAQCEANLAAIKERVRELQEERAKRGRITRLFRGGAKEFNELKAEAVRNIRQKRELEQSFDQIPGYDRLQGLTGRIESFQSTIRRIYRLSRELFDYNVTSTQINNLRKLVETKIDQPDPDQRRAGFKQYDLRLRAEILQRVLLTYSMSSYILRRPDALTGGHSLHNVKRINYLARNLIEYFGSCRYGNKTLGDAYEETWGQVIGLEARL